MEIIHDSKSKNGNRSRIYEYTENEIRLDERKKVLHYLVKNGYIKYGFDEKYLLEQIVKN